MSFVYNDLLLVDATAERLSFLLGSVTSRMTAPLQDVLLALCHRVARALTRQNVLLFYFIFYRTEKQFVVVARTILTQLVLQLKN